jgi:hypothetical protein
MKFPLRLNVVVFTVIVGFGYHQPNVAAEAAVEAKVLRVLIQADDSLGGCMALLSVNPGSLLPSCADGWVTFSCSGDYTDSVRAYRMLDQAQLAFATDRRVMVNFTDQRKHSGFCFANRFDIY